MNSLTSQPLAENVNIAFKDHLWKEHGVRNRVIVTLLLMYEISLTGFLLYIVNDIGIAWVLKNLEGIVSIMAVPLIAYATYVGAIHEKVRSTFQSNLAKSLGMTYEKLGDAKSVAGHLFALPDRYFISDVISGLRNGYPTRILTLTTVTGSGKNSIRRTYKVWEVDCKVSVPSIAVYPSFMRNYVTSRKSRVRRAVPITLEGDFNKHFLAFASEQMEAEAFQVLEPEHLQLLEGHFKKYGFITHGTKLYVFTPAAMIETRTTFLNALSLAQVLHERLVPELEGVSRTIDVLHTAFGYTTPSKVRS